MLSSTYDVGSYDVGAGKEGVVSGKEVLVENDTPVDEILSREPFESFVPFFQGSVPLIPGSFFRKLEHPSRFSNVTS